MADGAGLAAGGPPVAVIGLACRFPDADNPGALLDLVLTRRRAFRRLPTCRLDIADYYSPDPATPDATYSTRAAVLEGWQFDRSSFGVGPAEFASADPALWLALETSARALHSAGFVSWNGLAHSRIGVIMGNTAGGDVSRAMALRLRWPFVRNVLADALIAAGISRDQGMPVLRHAAARYLFPFPEVTSATLTGSQPASIASRICGYFGFQGGGYAVDGAASSSLLAVAKACGELAAGDLDVVVAGGVDVSLDPAALVGRAKTGLLAAGDMRVYDANPTGFLPGEGCGVLVLMRAAEARAAGLPVLAEIAGWGVSSAMRPGATGSEPASQLLALRRAYHRAGVDPADVQFFEGDGAGTAAGDYAELTALTQLRHGARRLAALGSVKANIGHTGAAAGAAGLIKTILAMSSTVIPPATGASMPHPLLLGQQGSIALPDRPVQWPAGPQLAAVSAVDPGGSCVHLVLSREPVRSTRPERGLRLPGRGGRGEPGPAAQPGLAATPPGAPGAPGARGMPGTAVPVGITVPGAGTPGGPVPGGPVPSMPMPGGSIPSMQVPGGPMPVSRETGGPLPAGPLPGGPVPARPASGVTSASGRAPVAAPGGPVPWGSGGGPVSWADPDGGPYGPGHTMPSGIPAAILRPSPAWPSGPGSATGPGSGPAGHGGLDTGKAGPDGRTMPPAGHQPADQGNLAGAGPASAGPGGHGGLDTGAAGRDGRTIPAASHQPAGQGSPAGAGQGSAGRGAIPGRRGLDTGTVGRDGRPMPEAGHGPAGRGSRAEAGPGSAGPGAGAAGQLARLGPPDLGNPAARTVAYLLHAPDRGQLAAILTRIADIGPWMSDAELGDLACQLAAGAGEPGPARVALVASRQEQLARLAREAITMLPGLSRTWFASRPGIFAADGQPGQVAFLLSAGTVPVGPAGTAGFPGGGQPTLAWLDQLGVQASAAMGHGLGEIAGLAWAESLPEADANRLARRYAEILSGSSGPAGPGQPDDRVARLRMLLTQFVFAPPRRRLVSAATGQVVCTAADVTEALCAQLESPGRLEEALAEVLAEDTDLLVETGPGQLLSAAAGRCGDVAAVSLGAPPGDQRAVARVIAALFAVGRLGRPHILHAGEPYRPIDIWRDRIFITNPCQQLPPRPARPHPVPPGGPPPPIPVPASPVPASPAPPVAGPSGGPGQPLVPQPGPAWNEAPELAMAPAEGPVAASHGGSPATAAAEGPMTASHAGNLAPAPAEGPVAASHAGSLATDPAKGPVTTSHGGSSAQATPGFAAQAGLGAQAAFGVRSADPGPELSAGPDAPSGPVLPAGPDAPSGPDAQSEQTVPIQPVPLPALPEPGTTPGPLSPDAPAASGAPAASAQSASPPPHALPQPTTGPAEFTNPPGAAAPMGYPGVRPPAGLASVPSAAGSPEPSERADTARRGSSSRWTGALRWGKTLGRGASQDEPQSDESRGSKLTEMPPGDGDDVGDWAGTNPGASAPGTSPGAGTPGTSTGMIPARIGPGLITAGISPGASAARTSPGEGAPGTGTGVAAAGVVPVQPGMTAAEAMETARPGPAGTVTGADQAHGPSEAAGREEQSYGGASGVPEQAQAADRLAAMPPSQEYPPGASAMLAVTVPPVAALQPDPADMPDPAYPLDPVYMPGPAYPPDRAGPPGALAEPARTLAELAMAETAVAELAVAELRVEAEPAGAPAGPTETAAAEPSVGTGPGVEAVAGIADWARCFAEELRAPRYGLPGGDGGPWRVIVAEDQPFGPAVAGICPDEPGAGQTLAVLGSTADPGTPAAAMAAATDAIRTGRLVVISPGTGLTGFWASLHAENPELGITLLRADGPSAFPAARALAAAIPGEFRELSIDGDGRVTEPVMVPADTPAGDFPLGPSDVVLIGRGGGGAALAMAQVLACCGASIAVVGEPGPDEDSKLIIGLERLRAAGARVIFEVTDPSDRASMAATLQWIQSELGPVTAVVHTARAGSPRQVTDLTEPEFRANATTSPAALRDLVSLLRPDLLRTIITFGSVAGRYGLAGQGLLALASAALAEQAGRLAASLPRCRAVHVAVPGWAGRGLGQRADLTAALGRAGVTSLLVKDGARLLLRLLATPGLVTPGLASRVAVHGRIGPGVPPAITAAAGTRPHGRFTRGVRLYYPGVELVADTVVSLRTDPYLADHRPGGQPSLPVAMALEAMAQAASELAGGPVRRVKGASVVAQIPVPADGTARLRVCALREGDTIRAVLRCEASAFVVDHVRAVFSCTSPAGTRPLADLPADLPAGPWAADQQAAGQQAADDTGTHVGSAGVVDGSELYGTVCFPTGRLRRVAFLPELSPRGLRALASGTDDEPWFSPDADPDGAPLILGNPGLNDATVHVLQACVPHRRLVVAGCESVVFSGRQTDGVVEIRAAAIPPAGREPDGSPPAGGAPETAQAEVPGPSPAPSSPQPVPPQRSPGRRAAPGPAEYHWDVDAVDVAGHLLVSWRGLRLRDAGPRPRTGSWPTSMLPVYLESCAVALGLDARLRVSITAPAPDADQGGAAAAAAPAAGELSRNTDGGAADPPPRADAGGPAGLALVVGPAPVAAGCWRAVSPDRPGPVTGPMSGAAGGALGPRLAERLAEPAGPLAARIRAIEACLPPGAGEQFVLDDAVLDDWVVLRAGPARLACTVVQISGVAAPVAVALITGLAGLRPAAAAAGAQAAGPAPQGSVHQESGEAHPAGGGPAQAAGTDPAEAGSGEPASAEEGGLPWVWLWADPACE